MYTEGRTPQPDTTIQQLKAAIKIEERKAAGGNTKAEKRLLDLERQLREAESAGSTVAAGAETVSVPVSDENVSVTVEAAQQRIRDIKDAIKREERRGEQDSRKEAAATAAIQRLDRELSEAKEMLAQALAAEERGGEVEIDTAPITDTNQQSAADEPSLISDTPRRVFADRNAPPTMRDMLSGAIADMGREESAAYAAVVPETVQERPNTGAYSENEDSDVEVDLTEWQRDEKMLGQKQSKLEASPAPQAHGGTPVDKLSGYAAMPFGDALRSMGASGNDAPKDGPQQLDAPTRLTSDEINGVVGELGKNNSHLTAENNSSGAAQTSRTASRVEVPDPRSTLGSDASDEQRGLDAPKTNPYEEEGTLTEDDPTAEPESAKEGPSDEEGAAGVFVDPLIYIPTSDNGTNIMTPRTGIFNHPDKTPGLSPSVQKRVETPTKQPWWKRTDTRLASAVLAGLAFLGVIDRQKTPSPADTSPEISAPTDAPGSSDWFATASQTVATAQQDAKSYREYLSTAEAANRAAEAIRSVLDDMLEGYYAQRPVAVAAKLAELLSPFMSAPKVNQVIDELRPDIQTFTDAVEAGRTGNAIRAEQSITRIVRNRVAASAPPSEADLAHHVFVQPSIERNPRTLRTPPTASLPRNAEEMRRGDLVAAHNADLDEQNARFEQAHDDITTQNAEIYAEQAAASVLSNTNEVGQTPPHPDIAATWDDVMSGRSSGTTRTQRDTVPMMTTEYIDLSTENTPSSLRPESRVPDPNGQDAEDELDADEVLNESDLVPVLPDAVPQVTPPPLNKTKTPR